MIVFFFGGNVGIGFEDETRSLFNIIQRQVNINSSITMLRNVEVVKMLVQDGNWPKLVGPVSRAQPQPCANSPSINTINNLQCLRYPLLLLRA